MSLYRAKFTLAAGGLLLLIPVAYASAQSLLDPSAAGPPGARYQMQPVDGGVVRLDTRTGAIDLCRVEGDAIDCTGRHTAGIGDRARIAPTPAGSVASGQSGDMATRLDALEARVGALEDRMGPLLDEEAADVAIDRMKKFFRGFADIVKDLENDDGGDRPDRDPNDAVPPMPGRT